MAELIGNLKLDIGFVIDPKGRGTGYVIHRTPEEIADLEARGLLKKRGENKECTHSPQTEQ